MQRTTQRTSTTAFLPARGLRSSGLTFLMLLAVLISGCDIFGEAFDERAPRVTLERPYDGATLTGANAIVAVTATATGDGNYISFINVNLDGTRVGEAEWDGNSAYKLRLNTFDLPDGLHRMEAVAFDKFQARGVSAPVIIQVQNISAGDGPRLNVIQPQNKAVVSGIVRVQAMPEAGGDPITRVDLILDGIPVLTSTTPVAGGAWAFDLDTSGLSAGDHALELKAFSSDTVFRLTDPLTITVAGGDITDPDNAGPGSLAFQGTGLEGEVKGSAAVGFNDDIYVGSSNSKLYAFDRSGKLRWSRDTKGPIRSSPVVGNNEDVFVASEDGRLWGFTADGRDLWATPYNSAAPLRTTPTMGVDGILYFGDSFGYLHAVNSFNGLSAWSSPVKVVDGSIIQPPVISRDHTIIVADSQGRLSGYDRNGDRLWQTNIKGAGTCGGGAARAPMALTEIQLTVELPTGEIRRSTEALIYVMADDGCLYAYSGFDGSRVWHYGVGGTLVSGPVVDETGTIFVGTESGLFSFNETADATTPRLRYKYVADNVGMPAIDTNGVIHFISRTRVVAINTNGTKYWEYPLNSEADGPVTINRQGQLIVPARNGRLYAFNTGSAGLAKGKWPMFQRNARHTGRIGIDSND